jgi:hypothetical protein
VKFYRIEHEQIGYIAEEFGPVRPGPDKLLEDALGEDYATRWQPHRVARIPGVGSRPMVLAGVAVENGPAPEQHVSVAVGLVPGSSGDEHHPARQRMIAMLKAVGIKGMTIRSIAEQLASDGPEMAHQTIHRWLAEEAAEGRVENASYGRWKWRDDRR